MPYRQKDSTREPIESFIMAALSGQAWVASATAELLRLQELTLLWLCLSRRHASQGFQGISRAEIMCALLQADKVPSAGGKESGCLCETAPCLRTQLMKGRSQECIATGLYYRMHANLALFDHHLHQ